MEALVDYLNKAYTLQQKLKKGEVGSYGTSKSKLKELQSELIEIEQIQLINDNFDEIDMDDIKSPKNIKKLHEIETQIKAAISLSKSGIYGEKIAKAFNE